MLRLTVQWGWRGLRAPLWGVPAPVLLATWVGQALVLALLVYGWGQALAAVVRWDAFASLALALPANDVHTLLGLAMVGAVESPRLAVGVPGVGHLALSFPFVLGHVEPIVWQGWVGTAFSSQSSPVGVHVARVLARVTLLVAGPLLAEAALALPQRRLRGALGCWLVLAPRIALAYAVAAMFSLSWGDEAGGGILAVLVASKAFGIDAPGFHHLLHEYAPWFSFVCNSVVVVASLALGYGGAAVLRWLLRRVSAGGRPLDGASRPSRWLVPAWCVASALLQVTPLRSVSGVGAHQVVHAAEVDRHPFQEMPLLRPQFAGPTLVQIQPRDRGWDYLVNGQSQVIRGIGYNPLAGALGPEERAEVFRRDFGVLAAAGFNTLLGWDPLVFNATLMDVAAEFGLGVVPPFLVDETWDFSSERQRGRVLRQVTAWVERHRNSPALRLWGLGNEVLNNLRDATPERQAAAARFVVWLADEVHRLDPDHPVLYRDAEAHYVAPLQAALADGVARPWFVYGMNHFTHGLTAAITTGPAAQMGQPLLVSEFAPATTLGPARHQGYVRMWRTILAHRGQVLGGFAYVWTRQGPEALDLLFGLTDGEGRPVDRTLRDLAAELGIDAPGPQYDRYTEPIRGKRLHQR